MRFSRVIEPSSVGLAGYVRAGVRQTAKTKNFMRRLRALSCGSIVVGYLLESFSLLLFLSPLFSGLLSE